MMRSIVILSVLVLTLVFAPAFAVADIAHGIYTTTSRVGPAAGGYNDLKPYTGSAIKDGTAYPFAHEVDVTTRYNGFEVKGPHLLIEGAAFSSPLDIYTSKPVVLRGVSIRPEAHSPVALLTRPGAGPVYVLWSDIGGSGEAVIDAALALRANDATIFWSHISGAADGISISGSNIRVLGNVIETRAASPGDHNDAIQLLGAPKDIEIAQNKILNRNPQTSCVTILGSNIRVSNNYLSGGGWTLYGGAMNNGKGGGGASQVSVTGNVFGRDFASKSGYFGPVTYWDKANAWSANAFSDGTAVTP